MSAREASSVMSSATQIREGLAFNRSNSNGSLGEKAVSVDTTQMEDAVDWRTFADAADSAIEQVKAASNLKVFMQRRSSTDGSAA